MSVRIAHFIATNFFGGPEKQVVTHARYLKEIGYDPYIVSFKENGRPNELLRQAENADIKTHALVIQGAFNPQSIKELTGFLRKEDIQLIASHGYKTNVIGRLASWLARVPKIAVSRGWTAENWKISMYESADRFFLRLADHVVAVSEGQRDKLLTHSVSNEKVSVIQNCIELNKYPEKPSRSIKEDLGVGDGQLLVATAGRLSPEKNQRDLVLAAAEIHKKHPEVHFAAFGDGVLLSDLQELAANVGLKDVFHFPGFRNDMHAQMHEVDIFVLPSLTEGLPNVVLEAYACRKPVVATRVGGTPELVKDGATGFLVEATDYMALSEKIGHLIEDSTMRLQMGLQGYELVESEFNFDAQTRKYESLYTDLMSAEFERNG